MGVKKSNEKQKPSMDPAAREAQLINLSYNLAEEQLRDGKASPSVITHFLKLASTREHLERQILESQKTLIEAKAGSIQRDKESEDLARDAIEAIKGYRSSQQEND